MALAQTARGVQLLVQVGNGADPEVFAAPCLINAARGIQFQADTNDVVVPDCDDPDLMAWVEREKKSLSATINGAGVLNTPDLQDWYDFITSADPKNIKVNVDVIGANGGRTFSGAFLCTQFELTGDRGTKIDCTVQMQSTGEVSISTNA